MLSTQVTIAKVANYTDKPRFTAIDRHSARKRSHKSLQSSTWVYFQVISIFATFLCNSWSSCIQTISLQHTAMKKNRSGISYLHDCFTVCNIWKQPTAEMSTLCITQIYTVVYTDIRKRCLSWFSLNLSFKLRTHQPWLQPVITGVTFWRPCSQAVISSCPVLTSGDHGPWSRASKSIARDHGLWSWLLCTKLYGCKE